MYKFLKETLTTDINRRWTSLKLWGGRRFSWSRAWSWNWRWRITRMSWCYGQGISCRYRRSWCWSWLWWWWSQTKTSRWYTLKISQEIWWCILQQLCEDERYVRWIWLWSRFWGRVFTYVWCSFYKENLKLLCILGIPSNIFWIVKSIFLHINSYLNHIWDCHEIIVSVNSLGSDNIAQTESVIQLTTCTFLGCSLMI